MYDGIKSPITVGGAFAGGTLGGVLGHKLGEQISQHFKDDPESMNWKQILYPLAGSLSGTGLSLALRSMIKGPEKVFADPILGGLLGQGIGHGLSFI